ncbi:hypothetical protein Ahy_A09g046102 [Arachis hypogaea]|uniref:Disease resistance protein n=1 Tax=Arachis hypogaea TaxID=3818 RepID=A0A445BNY7_ARAHY|nr:hypothetical protein Ahy_A09g046102 [Arachis hypogaea]
MIVFFGCLTSNGHGMVRQGRLHVHLLITLFVMIRDCCGACGATGCGLMDGLGARALVDAFLEPFSFPFVVLILKRRKKKEILSLERKTLENLVNLKEVDLAECRELIELPDFSKAYTLESVDLSYCRSLRHVHQTILSLGTLGYLNLHNCKKIKALESEIHLRSLQQLHVEGCSSLRKFSLSLEVESLNFSSRVKLSHLSVGCLSKVKDIYSGVVSKQTLHIIFDGLQYLLQLTLLDCHGLFELPDNINCLSSLQILELDGSAIERLPESIKHLSRLETLSLWNCKRLQCLPELPLSIINLKAFNCSLVQMVANSSTNSRPQ